MWRRLVIIIPALVFAFGILFTSVFRTAAVKYEFAAGKVTPELSVPGNNDVQINYYLAYPGKILPDHPLWMLKAIRDRIWLLVTTNSSRRAELKLLFADKRLGSAKILFEKEASEEGFSTLTKAEKYLEEATVLEKENRAKGENTTEFLTILTKASLKHYEIMQEIIKIAPEDAKPKIIGIEWYSKKVYEDSRNALLEKDITSTENPFDWK